jgi:hypothetical protein
MTWEPLPIVADMHVLWPGPGASLMHDELLGADLLLVAVIIYEPKIC